MSGKYKLYFEGVSSYLEYPQDIQRADLFGFLDSLVTRYHQKTGSILIVKGVDERRSRVLMKFGRVNRPDVLQKIFNSL